MQEEDVLFYPGEVMDVPAMMFVVSGAQNVWKMAFFYRFFSVFYSFSQYPTSLRLLRHRARLISSCPEAMLVQFFEDLPTYLLAYLPSYWPTYLPIVVFHVVLVHMINTRHTFVQELGPCGHLVGFCRSGLTAYTAIRFFKGKVWERERESQTQRCNGVHRYHRYEWWIALDLVVPISYLQVSLEEVHIGLTWAWNVYVW